MIDPEDQIDQPPDLAPTRPPVDIEARIQQERDRARTLSTSFAPHPSRANGFSQDSKLKLLNLLMGASAGIHAGAELGPIDNPLLAFAAGAGAGAGVPFQTERLLNEQKLSQIESAPIEQISPMLAQHYPELAGLPLGVVRQIAPLIERENALKEKFLNPQERAALNKLSQGQALGPADLTGVREGVIPASTIQSAGATKSTAQTMGQQLVDGMIPPSMLPGFGKIRAESLAQAKQLDPTFDPSKAEIDYQRRLATAKFESGSGVQLPVRQIQGILPNLDMLKVLSDRVPKSDIQLINRYGLKAASGFGSKEASDLQTLAAGTADEIQAIFGRGSDKKLDLAVDLLNTARTKEQFNSAVDIVKTMLVNRQQAFLGAHNQTEPPPGASSLGSLQQRAQEILNRRRDKR